MSNGESGVLDMPFDAVSYAMGAKGAGGGGGGAFIVNLAMDGTMALDKTWKEISDASETMPVVILAGASGITMQMYVLFVANSGGYGIMAWGFDGTSSAQIFNFITDSETGYPVMQVNNG